MTYFQTQTRQSHVIIRTMTEKDIPKIGELQKIAFLTMAAKGVCWKPEQLKIHLQVFSQGQVVAEYNGKIIGSCSRLIIQLKSEYEEHTWKEACGDSFF